MKFLPSIKPVYAHCDLPCGEYDPAQALFEAKSIRAIMERYINLDDDNKIRAIMLKEAAAERVKQHLMILWADYFKPEHLEQHPDIHERFWKAIKQASECKHHLDPELAQSLIDQITEIAGIFWSTKKA